jgi:periplasmic protein TonB
MTSERSILPSPVSFLSDSDELYGRRPASFLYSFLFQAAAIALALWVAGWIIPRPGINGVIQNIGPVVFPSMLQAGGGHGGGGMKETQPASNGVAPKMTLDPQLAPPEVVLNNTNPKLPIPASIVALAAVPLPTLGPLGDPSAKPGSAASNGPGGPTGIGSGCCGGIGANIGSEIGDSEGLVYRPGRGGVTQPRAIYDPDPEYSEEARRAKFQGSVLLWMVVGADGKPHNVRVQRSAGLGLDQKALEAVSKWRFAPATLQGHPVAAEVNVEVSFKLY